MDVELPIKNSSPAYMSPMTLVRSTVSGYYGNIKLDFLHGIFACNYYDFLCKIKYL